MVWEKNEKREGHKKREGGYSYSHVADGSGKVSNHKSLVVSQVTVEWEL